MSADPQNGPAPVGEEIHLPGPSVQPALVALGLLFLLLGVVDKLWLTAIGLFIMVLAIVSWVRAAAREMAELPAGDRH